MLGSAWGRIIIKKKKVFSHNEHASGTQCCGKDGEITVLFYTVLGIFKAGRQCLETTTVSHIGKNAGWPFY